LQVSLLFEDRPHPPVPVGGDGGDHLVEQLAREALAAVQIGDLSAFAVGVVVDGSLLYYTLGMLTSPSWPPKITSRNQSVPPVWLCGRLARAMTFPGGRLIGARSPAQARPRA
jgi:hypothetical protein